MKNLRTGSMVRHSGTKWRGWMIRTCDDRYDKERRNAMKTPIIPIERASENLIEYLIKVGILIVTEDGVKCAEK